MKKTVALFALAFALLLRSPAANLVWSPATANWDTTTSNWINTNTSAGAVFVNGDNVRFDDSGLGQANVALGANVLTPNSVVVDSSGPYTLASITGGKLTGAVSLTKKGSGTLILDADNAISGPTSIEGGVLQIGSGSGRGSVGSGPITNLTGLIASRTGTLNLAGTLSGVGALTNAAGTLNVAGTNTMSGLISINAGTVILSGAPAVGSSTDVHLNATPVSAGTRLSPAGGIDLPASKTIRMQGLSTGSHRTTLITLDGTTNSVSSPILIGEGIGLVQINSSSTNLGRLEVKGNISNHPDNPTPFSGWFYLRGSGNGILTGTVNLPQAKLIRTDAGAFTVASTGNAWSDVLIAVGTLRLGANNALPSVPFSMGQGAVSAILDLNGFNQELPGLNNAPGATASALIIANSSITSDSILTLSGGGVYSGLIQDSISNGTRRVGITINNGAQQLGSVCTYSGPTTINGGGLSLTGAGDIPNTTPIDLAAGAAIDVRYKSDSLLTMQPGQTLKGNGTFKIEGSLTSLGTIELKLNKSGGTLSNDQIQITSDVSTATVTYGGTLKLDLGGETLADTDSFKLFEAAAYSGTFSTINPITPGDGLAWDTSKLATDGTIRVVVGIATNPPNLAVVVVGGEDQLRLSWPEDHTGWTLQAQTNSINVGLNTNWFDVSGSIATNWVTVPVDATKGSVFYRLRYQP